MFKCGVPTMGSKSKIGILNQPYGLKLLRYLITRLTPDEIICAELGITRKTLYNWKIKHPEFMDLVSQWKEIGIKKAEATLYDLAHGYERDEPIRNSEDEIIGYKRVYYPPQFAATKFVLTNKKADEYKEKIDIESTFNTIPVQIEFKRKSKLPGLELPAKEEKVSEQ
jgi:hypothetical protein